MHEFKSREMVLKHQRPLAQKHRVKEGKFWAGWVCLGSCSSLARKLVAYFILAFPSLPLELVSKLWPDHLITCLPLLCFWSDACPESVGQQNHPEIKQFNFPLIIWISRINNNDDDDNKYDPCYVILCPPNFNIIMHGFTRWRCKN